MYVNFTAHLQHLPPHPQWPFFKGQCGWLTACLIRSLVLSYNFNVEAWREKQHSCTSPNYHPGLPPSHNAIWKRNGLAHNWGIGRSENILQYILVIVSLCFNYHIRKISKDLHTSTRVISINCHLYIDVYLDHQCSLAFSANILLAPSNYVLQIRSQPHAALLPSCSSVNSSLLSHVILSHCLPLNRHQW